MVHRQALEQSFIPFFSEHLHTLESDMYGWDAKQSALTKIGIDALSGDNDAERNIDLKHKLQAKWHDCSTAERIMLAEWIISCWGGIRRNHPERFKQYAAMADRGDNKFPIKGIASYSKVLAITDCSKYAIYDARVAAALTAVQLLSEAKERVHFPYIPGRNSTINGTDKRNGFVQIFSKHKLDAMGKWHFIPPREAYGTYLNLLADLKPHFQHEHVYRFEMLLFALAPAKCEEAIVKYFHQASS